MFEATLQKASTLKKVIEAIKDLVTDGNIEVSETGMNLQAMDSSPSRSSLSCSTRTCSSTSAATAT